MSYVLPSGRPLFSQLDVHFDAKPSGLVGCNGVGKSVLADILAGRITPTTGSCLRSGRITYPRASPPELGAAVADLAGIAPVLQALSRIEAGGMGQGDFNLVGDRWDIHQHLQAELAANALDHLSIERSATRLSGGEAMCVALAGAWLFLILEEPSNHLDLPSLRALGLDERLRIELEEWRREAW